MNRIIALSLIAFLTIFEITTIGRMLLSEVITPILFVYYFKPRNHLTRYSLMFASLAFVWLCGAIISDIYRNSEANDYLRGWFKIIFFTINFFCLYSIVNGNIIRAIFVVFALFISSAVRLYLGIGDVNFGKDVFGTAWKFGYGQLFTATVFLLVATFSKYPLFKVSTPLITFSSSLINLVFNARNLFMISFLSSAITFFTYRRKKIIPRYHIAALLFVVPLAAIGAKELYSFSAAGGYLGDAAKIKYLEQSSGSYGLLLGGRSESLVSVQAIKDSPIIGHGSWARDWEYAKMGIANKRSAGYETNEGNLRDSLIPTHSLIFGAWVESGITGAIFWLVMLGINIAGMYNSIRWPTPWSGFVMFLGISLLWDIWFSPLGLERRLVIPAWICLMILNIEKGKTFHMEQNKLVSSKNI